MVISGVKDGLSGDCPRQGWVKNHPRKIRERKYFRMEFPYGGVHGCLRAFDSKPHFTHFNVTHLQWNEKLKVCKLISVDWHLM